MLVGRDEREGIGMVPVAEGCWEPAVEPKHNHLLKRGFRALYRLRFEIRAFKVQVRMMKIQTFLEDCDVGKQGSGRGKSKEPPCEADRA